METEHVFNGRYRVDTRLGTGGMAIVYCGTDLLLRRRVAIKVLRDQFSSDDDFIKRFSYEAQAAARLSHPNIVNVYDFGREGDAYFIVMELVEGETLASILRDEHRVPESVAIDYATQIAAGLAFAHRQGLLHRDVKPANILVTHDDVVKLSDFGIARAVAENAIGVTQPGMVMGSVAYVSPEQAQGRELDARSDLYSLGVVLYQMITGRLPFTGETPVAVALKHVGEPAPALDASTGVSPALASIVATLLQKDPAARFASATELGRALREAREQPAQRVGAGARGPAATGVSSGAPPPPPRASAAPDRALNGTATYEEPLPPVFDRRWIPFAALLFVAAVLAGYLGVRALGPRPDVAVTDFSGSSSMQAQQSLVAAGLRPQVQLEASETVPTDRVVHQYPAAGTMTYHGAAVTLFVSSGPPQTPIPDVKGFTTADAQHTLANAKFKTKIVQKYDETAAKDTVLDVNPAVGTNAGEGSTVTLTISQGRQPVRIPQVTGLTLDAARALLARKGLNLNVDQQTPSDTIPSGTVVSQAQSSGTTIDPGSTVGVTVSSGGAPVAVPDVGGKLAADALAVLEGSGFTTRVTYVVDTTAPSGAVSAQDPPANATAPHHSLVTLTIAVPGTVPDLTNMTLDDAKNALTASGYTLGAIGPVQDGLPGRIVRTAPPANAALAPGSPVTLYYHTAGQ